MVDDRQFTNRCACGWEMTGEEEDVVPAVIEHGARIHNMQATREEVLARLESVDAPPGRTPRKRKPSRIPPACSSRISRIGVPIGSSQRPGRLTLPLTP